MLVQDIRLGLQVALHTGLARCLLLLRLLPGVSSLQLVDKGREKYFVVHQFFSMDGFLELSYLTFLSFLQFQKIEKTTQHSLWSLVTLTVVVVVCFNSCIHYRDLGCIVYTL
jgi:hypothetical protein